MAQVPSAHTLALVLAQASILTLVIPDPTLSQVPVQTMAGPMPTADQDSRLQARLPARLPGVSREDMQEWDILRQDFPQRDQRILVVEEDFRITRQIRPDIILSE